MIHTRGLTALHASSEEVSEWINQNNPEKVGVSKEVSDGENRLLASQKATCSGNASGGPSILQNNKPISSSSEKAKYPFICECFFMTARVLNLGLLKAFSDFKHLVQVRNWDLKKGNTKLYLLKEGCLEPCATVDGRLM